MNAIDSRWFRDDVVVLVERAGASIDSLVLPKVEGAAEQAGRWFARRARRAGGCDSHQALIETAGGLLRGGNRLCLGVP